MLEVEKLTPTADQDSNLTPSFFAATGAQGKRIPAERQIERELEKELERELERELKREILRKSLREREFQKELKKDKFELIPVKDQGRV